MALIGGESWEGLASNFLHGRVELEEGEQLQRWGYSPRRRGGTEERELEGWR